MKKPAKAAKPARKQPVKAAAPAAKHPQHPQQPKRKPPVSKAVQHARHTAAVKAAKTRAANAKKAKAHPRRQLALSEGVACCSAEALAASLRLTGWPVSDADVLALYWHTARDEHAGASILATLEAAAEYGLAGVHPVWSGPAEGGWDPLWRAGEGGRRLVEAGQGAAGQSGQHPGPEFHGLILGLALPAPHAVLDTGSEWITWGQAQPAWAFPDAVIEEAWEVTW